MAKKSKGHVTAPDSNVLQAPQRRFGKKAQRNFHACHPIMKKGGVHEKSRGAKRAAAKRDTRRKASEWLGRFSIGPAISVIRKWIIIALSEKITRC